MGTCLGTGNHGVRAQYAIRGSHATHAEFSEKRPQLSGNLRVCCFGWEKSLGL